MRSKLQRARLAPALITPAAVLMLAALFFLSFSAAGADSSLALTATTAGTVPTDSATSSNDFVKREVLAQLVSPDMVTDVTMKYNLTVEDSRLAPVFRFHIVDDNRSEQVVVNQLKADTQYVVWADVNAKSTIPIDPNSGSPTGDTGGNPYRTWKWGGDQPTGFRAQYAWEQVAVSPTIAAYPGSNTIVAVLDTGIDPTHEALANHVKAGRDLISDDSIPQDGPEPGQPHGSMEGHGTHVSGIILSVAPQASILPVRVLDQNGEGNTFALAYGIQWAVNSGANVINLSLGAQVDASNNLLSDTIAYAISKGVVVVAAVGNDNIEAPAYPAAFPNVIGVAAVDENRTKATFSNYGYNLVDLAAPGVSITSSMPSGTGVLYAAWSGTSMAAPFVSGAAARLHEKYPKATPEQIRDLLFDSGFNINSVNTAYTDKLGRELDVKAALEMDLPVPTPSPTPTPVPTQPHSTYPLYLPALLKPTS